MIWILRDGDEEIGCHYDLKILLKITETLEPKEKFSIGFDKNVLLDAEIAEAITVSENVAK